MQATNTEIELLKNVGPTMRHWVNWISGNLGKYEYIKITHWVNTLFYLEVLDSRDIFCTRARFGLTVNVANDSVRWSYDDSDSLPSGNCYVRAFRWKRRLSDDDKTRMHVYKERRRSGIHTKWRHCPCWPAWGGGH